MMAASAPLCGRIEPSFTGIALNVGGACVVVVSSAVDVVCYSAAEVVIVSPETGATDELDA